MADGARPIPMLLLDAQQQIYQQRRLAGILAAVTGAGARLGAPLYSASLLYDAGVDAWHTTALFGLDGRPVDLAALGIPDDAHPFTLPLSVVPAPLLPLFGPAWGEDVCERLSLRYGLRLAMVLPAPSAATPRVALALLLTGPEQAPLLAGVLYHAATAMALLLQAPAAALGTAVMEPSHFRDAAEQEIGRAERYARTMALVLFELESGAMLSHVGPAVLARLRRWDFVGRLVSDRPILAAVLPETDRQGGRGFLHRLRGDMPGAQVGLAVAPQDGGRLDSLVDVALKRASSVDQLERAYVEQEQGQVWLKGVPSGASAESVRCPLCRIAYTRESKGVIPAHLLEDARNDARTVLQQECPQHGHRLLVAVR